jgi:hypothetical protein
MIARIGPGAGRGLPVPCWRRRIPRWTSGARRPGPARSGVPGQGCRPGRTPVARWCGCGGSAASGIRAVVAGGAGVVGGVDQRPVVPAFALGPGAGRQALPGGRAPWVRCRSGRPRPGRSRSDRRCRCTVAGPRPWSVLMTIPPLCRRAGGSVLFRWAGRGGPCAWFGIGAGGCQSWSRKASSASGAW